MIRFFTLFCIVCSLTVTSAGQSLESLKLSDSEFPQGYKATNDKNCVSIQSCIFYDRPDMYASTIGKVKSKHVQNFSGRKDNGSIMYFEFEEDFAAEAFLGGLLWGGSKPSKQHPEEFHANGKFLVIWSCKKESAIKKVSQDKVKSILK